MNTDEIIYTKNGIYTCLECGNSHKVDKSKKVGEFIECESCGIEYKILAISEEGEYKLELSEQEK